MSPSKNVAIFGGITVFALLMLASCFTQASTIPNLVLYESDENLGYSGEWGADVDKFPDLDANYLFIKQETIDMAVAHIHSLADPFSAGVFEWEYWVDFVDFDDIANCYDDSLAVSPYRPCGNISPPSEVPLPAAAWLFLSAIMGLVVARRRHAG